MVGKYAHGFHVFRDGNQWCAVGPHFTDLMQDSAGFGDRVEDAVEDLRKRLSRQRWWQDRPLPTVDLFTVDFDNERRQRECDRYEDCETGVAQCHCLSP